MKQLLPRNAIGCTQLLLLALLADAAHAQSPHANVLISAVGNPNETAITLNPKNPQQVVAGANLNNAYFSTDGGLTWTRQQLVAPQTVWGDPSIVCDTTGAFYFLHLSATGYVPGGPFSYAYPFIDRMQVQRTSSAARQFSWRSSFGLNPPKQQDKGWLAVDRRTNALYCTWTEFDTYGSLNTRDSTRILFSRSLDGAQTWSTPVRISRRGGDAEDESNTVEGAVPAAGPNGEVYVSWAGPRGIEFNRSLDGGLTWPQGERLISPQPGGWAYAVPGLDRSNGLPVTACDLSRGPRRGTLYVNWTDQRNGPSDTDVWLASSVDGGLTWTAPRRVNNDPAGTHQFLTWMTVDQVTGHLWFVFYDRRNYPAGSTQTDVYGARSTDGGLTFQNFRLSQTPFAPDDHGFLGDYNNITAHNNVVRPCWTRMENNLTTSVWTALVDPTLLASTAARPVGLRLDAYPSPARELLNVAWELPVAAECSLTLRDALGRAVGGTARRWPAGAQRVELPVSGLAPGVYTLEAQLGSQRLFRRVLVQH